MRRTFAVVAAMFLGLGTLPVLAAECQPATAEELARYVNEKETEELVFFASWCGGCVAHLKDADAAKSVLVVAFDEKKSAEKALGSIFVTGGPKCFFDKDGSIVKAYEVTGLPMTKKLRRSSSET